MFITYNNSCYLDCIFNSTVPNSARKKIIIDSVEINFSVVFLKIQKFQPKNAFDA